MEYQNFDYEVEDGEIIITGYRGREVVDVVIPSEIDGMPVQKIGDNAFSCGKIASITIPDSVTGIGDGAFYNCSNLTTVTIPDGVTSIGSSAFYGTAYYNDSSNWENGVLYIGNHLIKAKTDINGSYTIKSGTKCIADMAFSRCSNLTAVIISDSVMGIGDWAFNGCSSLTLVTIPDSVTSIGEGAFFGCNKDLVIRWVA